VSMRASQRIRDAWVIVGVTMLLFVGIEVTSYCIVRSYSFVRPSVDSRSAADAYADREWAVAYFQEIAALPTFGGIPMCIGGGRHSRAGS
jgi:hypothetical protein